MVGGRNVFGILNRMRSYRGDNESGILVYTNLLNNSNDDCIFSWFLIYNYVNSFDMNWKYEPMEILFHARPIVDDAIKSLDYMYKTPSRGSISQESRNRARKRNRKHKRK